MKKRQVLVAPSDFRFWSHAAVMKEFITRLGSGVQIEPYDRSINIEHAVTKLSNTHENSDFVGLVLPGNLEHATLGSAVREVRSKRPDLAIIIGYAKRQYTKADRVAAAENG